MSLFGKREHPHVGGEVALMLLLKAGDKEGALHVLETPELRPDDFTFRDGSSRNLSFLMVAVDKQLGDLIVDLLAVPEAINLVNSEGHTALMHAVAFKNLPYIKIITSRGADVNIRDHRGFSALDYCFKMCGYEITKFMIDCGGTIDPGTFSDAMTEFIVQYDDPDTVRQLFINYTRNHIYLKPLNIYIELCNVLSNRPKTRKYLYSIN